MDFLSLFDPTDGGGKSSKKRHKEEPAKKKPEGTGKGRRRGRKSNGKNETLPEESSFLCEPHLSSEILVKDGSYIESYIEINERDDTKSDEKKPRRRNSGRKSRRRKKNSPGKESTPTLSQDDTKNLNNLSFKPKLCDENIGKNVNNLTIDNIDYKKTKRKSIDNEFKDRAVYNVIDKLEKVSLKDDMYLAGDFNTQDLESDFFYCSDENEEFIDDSTSEGSDSAEEVHGSLPPEPRFGNVEYKLKLSALCERRFQHLVTQLKWRLRSGGGSCVYVVGVRDCGALVGLRARALRASLAALRRMAGALRAHIAHVTARRVAQHRAVAEVYIKTLPDPQQSVELRIAVMGANEAGKSTLIGVLTQGELDNGNGSARLNMFRHQHEVKTGMTSSLSHEILGFDAQGNVVNYGCSELMTAERIGERSAKLVSFLDLAGHSKYQRTTRHGLTGYSPHYAQLVISATAGITPITEEHMGILIALQLPFSIVISKCELAPLAVAPLFASLEDILRDHNKKPLLITDENMARNVCGPQKLILDAIDADTDHDNDDDGESIVPVFQVSCVRGNGLAALHAYLLALPPPAPHHAATTDAETCEFQIDEIFHVGDSRGPVVGGLLTRGQLFEGDTMLIGPLDEGSFRVVTVRSIYRNRVPCGAVRAGQPASLGLHHPCPPVRPGMVLLAIPEGYKQGIRPSWGGCAPGHCKRRNELTEAKQAVTQNRKHARRKNKNLLQDIANVEDDLIKDNMESNEVNLYCSDSDEDKKVEGEGEVVEERGGECVCEDRVLLDDQSDPRGCMFFQAQVLLLRHSTAIYPGFQCTVHVGNVRQTAIIEGIMSRDAVLRSGESAPALFRFVRCPEYLAHGRQLLFTAGLGTRGTGRITQVFPYVP